MIATLEEIAQCLIAKQPDGKMGLKSQNGTANQRAIASGFACDYYADEMHITIRIKKEKKATHMRHSILLSGRMRPCNNC